MKLEFLSILHSPPSWFEEVKGQYLKKIGAYFPTQAKEIKATKKSRAQKDEKLRMESALLLKQVDPRDFLILLDERGKSLNSLQFAEEFRRILGMGKARIVICCGGAYGAGEDLKARADLELSLSGLTYNHLIAQAVAYEQVYRALSIINNHPYHNE